MKKLIRAFWLASISALSSFLLVKIISINSKPENWGAAIAGVLVIMMIFPFIFAIFLTIFCIVLRKISDNIMAILGIPSLVLASISVASGSGSNSTVVFTFFYSLLLGLILYGLTLLDTHK